MEEVRGGVGVQDLGRETGVLREAEAEFGGWR